MELSGLLNAGNSCVVQQTTSCLGLGQISMIELCHGVCRGVRAESGPACDGWSVVRIRETMGLIGHGRSRDTSQSARIQDTKLRNFNINSAGSDLAVTDVSIKSD